MRHLSGPTARLSEKLAAIVDAVAAGAERLLGGPTPQPRLVPVRVRDGRRSGSR